MCLLPPVLPSPTLRLPPSVLLTNPTPFVSEQTRIPAQLSREDNTRHVPTNSRTRGFHSPHYTAAPPRGAALPILRLTVFSNFAHTSVGAEKGAHTGASYRLRVPPFFPLPDTSPARQPPQKVHVRACLCCARASALYCAPGRAPRLSGQGTAGAARNTCSRCCLLLSVPTGLPASVRACPSLLFDTPLFRSPC